MPRAVPNVPAQGPHCTVQGIPRKHQAPATHHNSTSDPTGPTSPVGTYWLNRVALSRFLTRRVRSPQARGTAVTSRPHGRKPWECHSPTRHTAGGHVAAHTRKPCPIKARHMQKSFSVCTAPAAQSPHSTRAPTPQGVSTAGAGGSGQEKARVPCQAQ